MIVQTAPEGSPYFVILQTDHARMSGQIAEAFGNDVFASLAPREAMIYAAAHHDEGWAAVDAKAGIDADTGLPYNLVKTPLEQLIATGSRSPDHNEAHHPYAGLMSSMHTYGLYHGRYGMSDFLFIDRIPDHLREQVDAMLAAELARQERLKAVINADEDLVFHNYKLMQFFDTLALYFHMTHPSLRGEQQFTHVPQAPGEDLTLTIQRVEDDHYTLSPYPFAEPDITLRVEGRYLHPVEDPTHTTWPDLAAAHPVETQTVTVTA